MCIALLAFFVFADGIELISPTNSSFTNISQVNFTANISESGLFTNDNVSNFSLYFGTWDTWTRNITNGTAGSTFLFLNNSIVSFNLSNINDGVYNWSVEVKSNSTDELFTLLNGTNYTITVDTTPPSATLVAPSSGLQIGETIFNVSVTDATSYANTVNVSLEAAGIARTVYATTIGTGDNSSGSWNVTIDLATLADAYYNVSFNVTDGAGNLNNTVNITSITVDNTAPNSSIVSPLPVINQSADFVLIASANDTLNLSTIQYRLENSTDNTTWTSMNSAPGNNYNVTIDVSAIADGMYNITVNVTDVGNNNNISNLSSVTIDSNAPAVNITAPSTGTSATTGAQTFLNATVSDYIGVTSQAGNVTWRYENTTHNGTWTSMSLNGTSYNGTINTTPLALGAYTIRVNATDALGTQNTTQSIAFTVAAVAAADDDDTTSSSSGGSSGGGGSFKPGLQTVTVTKVTIGDPATFRITKVENPVQTIVIVSKKDVSSPRITVGEAVKPSTVKAPIESSKGVVRTYLSMISSIPNSDLDSVTVTFKVPKTWYTDASTVPGNTVLYRYSYEEREWTALKTTQKGSAGNDYTFEAESPGFSLFAITALSGAAPVEPEPQEPVVEPETPEQPTDEAPVPPTVGTEPQAKDNTLLYAIGILVLAIVIAGAYFMRPKPKKK